MIQTRQKVNLVIIGVNIIVFLILSILGNTQDVLFMLNHGADYAPLVLDGKEYYRLFTCMFLHFGIEHLVYNMMLLFFLGDILESLGGKFCYLTVYLIGGVGANFVSVLFESRSTSAAVSAGASGAIFAVLGALVYIVILNHGQLSEVYSGKRLMLMAVLTIAESFTQTGVDNTAHVAGFAAGFLIAVLFTVKLRKAAE